MITFILFKCHRFIDNSNDSCCKKAHDNKECSCENSNPHHESRITKRQLNPVEIHFFKVFKTKNALSRDPTVLLMFY